MSRPAVDLTAEPDPNGDQLKLAALMADDSPDVLLGELLNRPAWMRDSLCIEHPELAWTPSRSVTPATIDRCRAVCARCRVRAECLRWALEHDERGVWGGTTDDERRGVEGQSFTERTGWPSLGLAARPRGLTRPPGGHPLPDVSDLDGRHRETVTKIFQHPTSGNIEWHDVESLLQAVGSVEARHSGKLKVTVGSTSEVLEPPRGKDVDEQMIADLRRLLAGAGYGPDDQSG